MRCVWLCSSNISKPSKICELSAKVVSYRCSCDMKAYALCYFPLKKMGQLRMLKLCESICTVFSSLHFVLGENNMFLYSMVVGKASAVRMSESSRFSHCASWPSNSFSLVQSQHKTLTTTKLWVGFSFLIWGNISYFFKNVSK